MASPSAAAGGPPGIGLWASAQVPAEPQHLLDPEPLGDKTVRNIVRVSAAGRRLRIRLSNAFGRKPLVIDAAGIARAEAPGEADIVAASRHRLTFSGSPSVTIAPGREVWSDPVDMETKAFGDLAISLHFPTALDGETGHGDARSTNFVAQGDQVDLPTLRNATGIGHWFQLSAIAADGAPQARAIVTLGDSITDSYMSSVDGNDRWPDLLARRLHDRKDLGAWSVLNEGLGGNRVLTDIVGPRLLDRLDRDLFSLPGASTVILLEGVNDLGALTHDHPVSAEEHRQFVGKLIAAYRLIIDQAHRHGMKVIGGTIMPYGGSSYYHPDAANEADRQAVNAWIRAPGHFDGMIDFDGAVRDPAHPDRLLPAYDSGDHIHPSVAGYQAMADAIPLELLTAPLR
ncbi:SGNH/GDSL hydrolase family protein [Sphingomonas sp. PR090111-T3T-6A]|uniref:SGNH/GDSL hydrolase family protein n=1 Tax=Sphingomonas sp. PR090111-T3T-6A TaxID=685778 RepID=UPI001F3F091E|nr:SGNH/GDSL hydrolase family protein [Sphingomonas sp. PR090111-T3T-6A]